jgi:outer membrane protein TolC
MILSSFSSRIAGLTLALSLLILRPALSADALSLGAVIDSVTSKYPPYLMALIERDIAAGRLRQAKGSFDLNFLGRSQFNPDSYYDGNATDFVFDQPLPFWGGNVFAGYRVSSGFLADYDKTRTQTDGELRAGLKLNLLRDGRIDKRRADLWKARLDQEIADPFIQRQQLDIVRAATRSYYNWIAMGLRFQITEELLRIAKDRDVGIAEQAKKGLIAPIIKVDNERLVISRQIAVVQARRRFEAAGIELSLFHRDEQDEPKIPARHQLPSGFPKTIEPQEAETGPAILNAFSLRPEIRRIRLVQEKWGIDQRLARNNLLPNLDIAASVNQSLGNGPYKDVERTESQVGIEFRVPLQRNEAKGRLQTIDAELERLRNDEQFARDRIVAEIRDAFSGLKAAHEQIGQTRRNVELAKVLEDAEAVRLKQGATDLLALQIREQAAFDAKLLEVDAQADYFRNQAEYEAATAIKLRAVPTPLPR